MKKDQKIIPNILDLLETDEKFAKVLGDPKYVHPIRISATAESVREIGSLDLTLLQDAEMSQMSPAEREKFKKDYERRRKALKEYDRKHAKILSIFRRLISSNRSRLEMLGSRRWPSGGWGIKLASFMQHERRTGRVSREEFNAEVYYHIMLILDRGELRIEIFKPFCDFSVNGDFWGHPLPPGLIPQKMAKLLTSLAAGGRSMVKTILTTREELVYRRH